MNKKLIIPFFLIVALFTFQGCSGPAGPQGLDGYDGKDGLNGVNGKNSEIGTTFDLVNTNFGSDNDFSVSLSFADNDLKVLESDAVLIYIQWDNVTINGQNVATWRLLPQTAILDKGLLIYNFDRTIYDFSIFLDANFDLNTLSNDYTKNNTFRVVILPSDFPARRAAVDYKDYDAVKKMLNIDESKIKKLQAK